MTIGFSDIKDLKGGARNSVASQLMVLRKAKNKADVAVGGIDKTLAGMSSLSSNGFASPDIPDINTINSTMNSVSTAAATKLNDLVGVGDLAGGCLDKAVSSLFGMMGDTRGFMDGALDSLQGLVSPEVAQLQKLMDLYREYLKSLGLDKIVSDLKASLGCLADGGVTGEVLGEVDSTLTSLGLNSDGVPEDSTYYDSIKQKMLDNGLSLGFADSLSDATSAMSTESANIAESARSTMKGQLDSLKPAPPEATPAPSEVW